MNAEFAPILAIIPRELRRGFLFPLGQLAVSVLRHRAAAGKSFMLDDLIAEFDRRLTACWFDGVVAVLASGALTASLRFVVETLAAA